MKVTYKIAMAAGWDAANRRMQKRGATAWNASDFNHAAKITAQLLALVPS